jgi:hypothetical protein
VNDEKRQRRKALRDSELIYLGNELNIGDFDGEYRLVPIEEYYEEWD